MTQDKAQQFIGAWRLVSFEIQGDDGNNTLPFGPDPKGTIIYTDNGRFSVQLMRGNRPEFAEGDPLKGTPEEIEAGFNGCISYYGAYEPNQAEGFVIHKIEGSMFPNWEATDQKRFAEFSGNRLQLRTPPLQWDGDQRVGVVTWERIG